MRPPCAIITRYAERSPRNTARRFTVEHLVPVVVLDVLEHLVAHDGRVRDEAVEATERVERGLHDLIGTVGGRDAVDARDRLAARRDDLVDHGLRTGRVGSPTLTVTPQVVDDDLGAAPRQLEALGAAEPARAPGHDDHIAVERQGLGHDKRVSCDRATRLIVTLMRQLGTNPVYAPLFSKSLEG